MKSRKSRPPKASIKKSNKVSLTPPIAEKESEPTKECNVTNALLNSNSSTSNWKRVALFACIVAIIGLLVSSFIGEKKQDIWEFRAVSVLKDILPDEMSTFSKKLSQYIKPAFSDEPLPGYARAAEGAEPYHPIVMIPGIVGSGLEIWKGKDCFGRADFRKRLWGSLSMLKYIVQDGTCWMNHLMINITNGLDPDGIKIRPAQGLEGADYFLPGYWMWSKLIENFAAVGYDQNSMYMATYDWRLSLTAIEERDGFYTKLQKNIEYMYASNGNRKVVVMAHSMGNVVWNYFSKRVSDSWVEKHIETHINIAGPLLGVPKATASLISGEMRDTALLGAPEAFVIESILSRKQRRHLFRSWGALYSLLPKGGYELWQSVGQFLEGTNHDYTTIQLPGGKSMNADEATEFIFHHLPEKQLKLLQSTFNFGLKQKNDSSDWTNPFTYSLPNAPSMKMYCLYGIGKPTEYGYVYTNKSEPLEMQVLDKYKNLKHINITGLHINTTYQDTEQGIINGVKFVDGDGSVPLISLGYTCAKLYKEKQHNPAGIPVVIREYVHTPVPLPGVRGGKSSGDHVDILGNYDLASDILDIVTNSRQPEPKIVSKIREYQ